MVIIEKKHKKVRRNYGGINIFVQNYLRRNSKSHSDILRIKMDRTYFKLNKDIYIYVATIYNSPEHSSSNVDGIEPIYEQLIADVVKFSSLGHVIVQGDFNAYANTKQDFVSYDDSGRSNPKDDHYISDQNLPRNNLDGPTPSSSIIVENIY